LFAERLRARLDIPVALVDERLTTVEASRRADESGTRTNIDSLAACVLLESFLTRT
jgi:RNase H-fold protein (predicted Holliday junction resolvase)